MRKYLFLYLWIFLLVFSSCKKDEYSDPHAGSITYNFPPNWNSYPTNISASNIVLDNSEKIWFSTQNHLMKISLPTNFDYDLSSYLTGHGASISSIVIDNSNNIWIGSYQNYNDSSHAGVLMFDGTNFYPFSTSNSGLHNGCVYSIAIDAMNVKWIGTKNSLVMYDGTTWSYYDTLNSPLKEFYPLVTTGSSVWIAGTKSLKNYDGISFTSWDTTNSAFPACGMRIVDKDNFGNLWFVDNNDSSLWKFDGANFTSFPIPSIYLPESSWEFSAIKLDAGNNVWLAGYGSLIKFDGISNWISYPVPSFDLHGGYSSGGNVKARLNSMCISNDSTKWFSESNFSYKNIMSFKE